VSELDRDKLSEWCLQMMGTDLAEKGLEKAVFCAVCVMDAR
jgi:hypothetical protein